jgi:hypothetical protein
VASRRHRHASESELSCRPFSAAPFARTGAAAGLVGAALLLTACGSPTNTTSQRVSAWVSSTALVADINQVKTDAANVEKVEGLGNPGAIRTNCAVLDLDTETANQNLPSPDQQLTQELSDAYTAEIQAAQDCYHGAGKSKELIARGQIAQTAANADIAESFSLVTQLTGHSAG